MKITQGMLEHAEKGGRFKFWDNDKAFFMIGVLAKIGVEVSGFSFATKEGGWFKNIEIYKPEIYVKDAVSIMKQLIADGYEPDEDGDFRKGGNWRFDVRMWQYCGKVKPKTFGWLPEWLEEK